VSICDNSFIYSDVELGNPNPAEALNRHPPLVVASTERKKSTLIELGSELLLFRDVDPQIKDDLVTDDDEDELSHSPD
jgi:hypothetical protein